MIDSEDYKNIENALSELLHGVGVNKSACNGTAVLHEIIINHANEIQEKDLKDKIKISNETFDSNKLLYLFDSVINIFEYLMV